MASPEFPESNEASFGAGESLPVGGQPDQQLPQGLAITSMVLGIVSIVMSCCCWPFNLLPAIAAIICGFMAKGKADQGEARGKGMAMAGIICGFVAVALAVLVLILYLMGVGVNFMQNMQDM